MQYAFYMFLFFFLIKGSPAAEVDLVLSIENTFNAHLEVGEIRTFEITVTNNGPDTAGIDSPVAFPIVVSTGLLPGDGSISISFDADPSMPDDCLFFQTVGSPRPPDPLSVDYSFYLDLLPPNTTVSCLGRFQAFREFNMNEITWSVFSVTDDDINEANNRETMQFIGTPRPVNTLNYLSVSILMLLMIIMGLCTKQRFS